jgi:hypothetical protein
MAVDQIQRERTRLNIHPVSLLLAAPFSELARRRGRMLGLSEDTIVAVAPNGSCGRWDGDSVGLCEALLGMEDLKIPRSAECNQGHLPRGWPKGLEIEGTIRMFEVTGLSELPEFMRVGGHLRLACLPDLQSLPDTLIVEGNLDLKDLPSLHTWPSRMLLGGDLREE